MCACVCVCVRACVHVLHAYKLEQRLLELVSNSKFLEKCQWQHVSMDVSIASRSQYNVNFSSGI